MRDLQKYNRNEKCLKRYASLFINLKLNPFRYMNYGLETSIIVCLL